MKKIALLLLLSLFISFANIDWTMITVYAVKEETALSVDLYMWSTAQYDKFLSEPDNMDVFRDEDIITIDSEKRSRYGFTAFSDETLKVLNDDTLIYEFLKNNNADIEIYDRKIVRPSELRFYTFKTGDFIWYSTSAGIKIIRRCDYAEYDEDEYKSKVRMKEIGDQVYIYYDNVKDYINQFKRRDVKVFVNGEQKQMLYFECRNNCFYASLRSYLEAYGISVDWQEKYSQVTMQRGEQRVYGFMEDYSMLRLIKNEQYIDYINYLDGGDSIGIDSVTGDFFDEIYELVDGRIIKPQKYLWKLCAYFGVETENVTFDGENVYITIKT